jgi:uncharacterized protein (TIGR02246 family)
MVRVVRILLVAGVLGLAPSAFAANPALEKTLEAHLGAIKGRDLPTLLGTVDDGVVVVLPNGKLLEGKKAYTAFHEEFFAEKGWTMEFHELRRIETADQALVFYEYTYREGAEAHKNYLAMTFHRTGGKWLLVHDQNTRQPQP